ncbi:hypothetical protein [Brevundimonas sp.]|uniref:hypothetical protein n=1 Tax=Brevundimonas sp. TaxID=1871086 RepID=UPI003D140F16
MKRLAVIGMSLCLSGFGAPVQAQIVPLGGEALEDVQCFSLFAMIAGQSGADANAVVAGEVEASALLVGMTGGMMYHLGRLQGREPDVDWLARIERYLRTVDIADLEQSRTRCAKSMTDNGAALVAWGERLQKE